MHGVLCTPVAYSAPMFTHHIEQWTLEPEGEPTITHGISGLKSRTVVFHRRRSCYL